MQVRRRIEPHPQPRFLRGRGDERASRSFSLGTGDMRRGIADLGIMQESEEGAHPSNAAFGARRVAEEVADEPTFVTGPAPELVEGAAIVPVGFPRHDVCRFLLTVLKRFGWCIDLIATRDAFCHAPTIEVVSAVAIRAAVR